MFRTYCDGSDGSGIMTLASVSADVALWCSVEREWMRALADLRIEEWHTADAIGRSPSSEFSSWKAGDFIKAFDRLASKALFQFRHAHLTANSCSIVMDDYHRFRRDHPDFKKKPEAICVDVCVGGVNYADVPMVGPDETVPFVGVFFDENERFERTIRRVWQDRRKVVGTIFHQIITVSSVNSRYTPAVQIADLIAWTAHRANSPFPVVGNVVDARNMQDFLSLCVKHYTRVCDYDGLVAIRGDYEREREEARTKKNG